MFVRGDGFRLALEASFRGLGTEDPRNHKVVGPVGARSTGTLAGAQCAGHSQEWLCYLLLQIRRPVGNQGDRLAGGLGRGPID